MTKQPELESFRGKTFPPEPYVPDNKVSLKGLGNLFGSMAFAGSALGFLASFIGQWIYFILIFPVLIGALIGHAGTKMIISYKVRNPLVAGVSGLLAGIFAMAVMHYADYRRDSSWIKDLDQPTMEFLALDAEQRQSVIAQQDEEGAAYLQDLISAYDNFSSFTGYMNLAAENGVSIGKATSSSDGMELGYVGTWIFWLIEILIVAGLVFAMTRKAASEPFCAVCDQWKQMEFKGSFPVEQDGDIDSVVQALQEGNLYGLTENPRSQDVGRYSLYSNDCGCEVPPAVEARLDKITRTSADESEINTLVFSSYPGESRTFFDGLFPESPEEPTTHPLETPEVQE